MIQFILSICVKLPLIYHRNIRKNKPLYPNLESLILNSNAFSEFNALGSWAHRYHSDKYMFENTDNWQYVEAY